MAPASAPRAETAPGARGERAVLATAALGTMLLPLNSTMIAVALPDIVEDLGVSLGSAAWLVSGYLIAQASLQPLGGKLGDRFGRRPLLVAGLASFAGASLGAAVAPSLGALIACRVLQAVTGAMVFPNALALVRELLPERRRGRAFGMLGSAIGLAAAAGPPVGGGLLELGGWRAIFLVNVPWVAAALWLTLRTVPGAGVRAARGRFDYFGAVSLSLLLVSVAWLMQPGNLPAWAVLGAAAILAILIVGFIRFELGHDDPVLQPRFLRVRPFAAATASVGLSNLALYGTLLAVPLLLARRPGWSAAEIGLSLAAMSVPMVVLSPVGGWLSDRVGRRGAATAGLAMLAAALLPLGIVGADVPTSLLVASLALAGAGIGLSNAAVQAAGIEALDARDAGVASGIFSTGRYVGGIAAASLVAALANGDGADYGLLFTIEAAAALLSMALALVLPGRPRVTASEELGGQAAAT
jgi:EmrB/QacA subfamily drug resistance transporter